MIDGVQISDLTLARDARGWLCELVRQDELPDLLWPAMAYVSATAPGVTRGPHEHREQYDCFVFLGTSPMRLQLWDHRASSPTWKSHIGIECAKGQVLRVVVPPGVIHSYTNCGSKPGLVLNFPNKLYRGPGKTQAVDEIRYEGREGSWE